MSALGRKAVSGVLWNTGLNVFRDFLQFGVMLILVRLIMKEAYGEFGLVSAILGFLSVFSFRAFLEYTLQIRPGSDVDYQTYFTSGAVIQLVLFIGTNLAAIALKYFPKFAPIAPVVHVASIMFLLDLGNEFRVKMLERDLDWPRLRILQGIAVLLNAALSVILALAGAGVYALVIPTLMLHVPQLVDLFFVRKWRPTWKFDSAAFRPAKAYGLTRLMSALFIWSRQLVESVFLVQIAGFALYGVYGRALGLASMACLKVPSLLTQALFPVLTKMDPGSGASSRASALVMCSVTWTTIPVAVILSVLAAPVVHALYGAKWDAAIPFIPMAMAAGAATALAQTGTLLLVANLHQKKSFYTDSILLVGTIAGLVFLAPRSIKLYLGGTAVFQSLAFALMLVWLLESGAIDLRGVGVSLGMPALCAGMSLGAMQLFRMLLGMSTDTLLNAVLCGALFSAVYVLLLRLSSRRQCQDIVSFLPGRQHLERWLLLRA